MNPSRPAAPGRPAEDVPADVYIYRDTGDSPDSAASTAPEPGERDASYWYDLPATGPGISGAGTGTAPVLAGTRGPFEPLVSSHGPAPVPTALVPEPAPAPDSSAQQAVPGRTGKLEQIR